MRKKKRKMVIEVMAMKREKRGSCVYLVCLYLFLISGGEVVKPKQRQRGREGVKELVFLGISPKPTTPPPVSKFGTQNLTS